MNTSNSYRLHYKIYYGTRKITTEAEFPVASYFCCVEDKNSFSPVLFGLAIAADNRMLSKQLNNVLYKCRFAFNHDE